ncbi:MAG: peptide synthase, partial [Prevotella sp.]|nr:peptide synthase [Prevotella sp.]
MKNVIFYDTILTPIQKLLEGKAGNKAFCIQDQYYTFGQLSTRIQTIREKLAHTDEQYIGLIASDALDTYAAILAIWMEGKCYVPLHPLQP